MVEQAAHLAESPDAVATGLTAPSPHLVERLNRRLQALSQAALRVQEALTPSEVLVEIGAQLKAIGLDWHYSLLDETGNELVIENVSLPNALVAAVERLIGIRVIGLHLKVEQVTVLRVAVRERRAVFTAGEGAVQEIFPRLPALLVRQLVKLAGVHRVIVAPLLTRGQVIGALTVWASDLVPEDLPAIIAFAQQAATAYDNARLLSVAQAERARLEAVLQQLPAGVLIAEAPSGRVVMGNAQVQRILGQASLPAASAESSQEQHGFHLDGRPFRPGDWPMARAIGAGETVSDELVDYRRSDGTRAVLSVNAAPIRDRDGKVVAGVVTFYDVTERKQSEDAQRFLARASAELGSSLDYEATLRRVARLVVPGLADWCAIDVVGEDGALQHVALVHSDREKETRARELPRGSSRDAAFLRALGAQATIVAPLQARGRTLGTITLVATEPGRRYGAADLALVEELADRAALAVDNALLYREAQQAVKVRDDFLSVAAHELKTPVTSLRGFAQLALRQLDRTGAIEPARGRQALERITRQADRLAHLVVQLLDVSRIEAGRLLLERSLVDVVRIVEAATQAAQTQSSRHVITVTAPPSLPAVVDPLRLEQVITNLLDNAIKYSPAGGPIEVTVSLPDEATVAVAVRDHGVGIPAGHHERIFDRFYRGQQHEHISGLGIGLYISRQITELHGGVLQAESPSDGGSRFLLLLPRDLTPSSS